MNIAIRIDDLSSSESQSIVREHMAGMLANTPIESVHALPLDKLKNQTLHFGLRGLDLNYVDVAHYKRLMNSTVKSKQ